MVGLLEKEEETRRQTRNFSHLSQSSIIRVRGKNAGVSPLCSSSCANLRRIVATGVPFTSDGSVSDDGSKEMDSWRSSRITTNPVHLFSRSVKVFVRWTAPRRSRDAVKYHRRLCGRLVISDQREGPAVIKSHDVTAIEPRKLNIDRVSRRDQARLLRVKRYMLRCFDNTVYDKPATEHRFSYL